MGSYGDRELVTTLEPVPEEHLDLFDKPSIATFASILPDGQPHVTPVWVDYDGEHDLVVTRKETRKYRNARRDPRVTVTVIDPDDPYRYVEVRGTVLRLPESGALAFSDRQARRHWGVDEYPFARETPRGLVHIQPERVVARSLPTPSVVDRGAAAVASMEGDVYECRSEQRRHLQSGLDTRCSGRHVRPDGRSQSSRPSV